MARLAEYRAQAGLSVPARPRAQLRDFVGPALGQVGGALANLGGALEERQQRRDAFEADVQYRGWRNRMNQSVFDAEANMPEGGSGFAKGFMDRVFTPSLKWLDGIENPDVQARLRAKVEDDRSSLFLDTSRRERSEMYRFQGQALDDVINETRNAINGNPEQYEELLAGANDSIAASNLPASARGMLARAAEQEAIKGYLDANESDPLKIYRELGYNIAELPTKVQETLMATILMDKGAIGNINFDPAIRVPYLDTSERAGEQGLTVAMLNSIADRIGDPGPEQRTADGWEVYLSNPVLAAGYVQERVSEVLGTDPKDPLEFFARFYFGNDIKSDDVASALPKGVRTLIRSLAREIEAPAVAPSQIPFVSFSPDGTNRGELAATRYDNIDPALTSMVRSVMSQFGEAEVKIRDAERPGSATYGAANSQHKVDGTGRRGAYDIDVRHMTQAQRVQLIEAFSAAGAQGIGVYRTTIHVDLGARRGWGQGSDGRFTFANTPAWAKDVVGRHRAGLITSAPIRTMAPRLQNIDADLRTKYGDAAASSLRQSVRASLPEMRAEATSALETHLAALEQGGSTLTPDTLRDTLEVLTPAARNKAVEDVNVATNVRAVFEAMSDGTDGQIEDILEDLAPKPGVISTPAELRIQAGAVVQAEEIRDARRRDPAAEAITGSPELQELWSGAATAMVGGGLRIQTQSMRDFIAKALEYQRRFGLEPKQVKHLPVATLRDMADEIDNITRTLDPEVNKNALFRALISRAEQDFGEYAYDVLVEAIQEIAGSDDDRSPEARLLNVVRAVQNEVPIDDVLGPDAAAGTGASGGNLDDQEERLRNATAGMLKAEGVDFILRQRSLSQEDRKALIKRLFE